MKNFILPLILAAMVLVGCAPPGSAIYERHRLAALNTVQSEVNASDMTRYIIDNETGRLTESNARTTARYQAELSVASSPEEGAALMGEYLLGLDSNKARFVRDVDEALKMVERQRLVGRASDAINQMADSEAAIARRTFDLFVANELPRIMEEAASAIKEIEAANQRRLLEEEIARAKAEAERKEREAEHEEPEPEAETPAVETPPLTAPERIATDNTGA